MDRYSKDEAMRVVSVTVMLEGHSYIFRVHNSGGKFTVMFERHEYPKGFLQKEAKCCSNVDDPCAVESRDLKDALWESIAMHKKQVHYLTIVS